MAENQGAAQQPTNYVQGYSAPVLQAHGSRTATSDAAFLLPHLKTLQPGARVLDVGCGPGSITITLAHYMPAGSFITGIELTDEVLDTARQRAAEAKTKAKAKAASDSSSAPAPGVDIVFAKADVLQGLPFADGTFDVVYASQLFPHMKPGSAHQHQHQQQPERAMREMRRVLKPAGRGLLATRDAIEMQFFPRDLGGAIGTDMVRFERAMCRALARPHLPGGDMPGVCRRAGFDVDAGPSKLRVGVGSTVVGPGREAARAFADGFRARLAEGNDYRKGWEDAGVTVAEIEELRRMLGEWAETPDTWVVVFQCELLAWT